MLAGVALRKTASGREFASEAALEDFVWDNLQHLFGLTPIARQHPAKGEFCDIIAVDSAKRLSILELKNTEDRYIVQQLTRYYDNLLDEKPFADKIDYNQPVELLAIAPSFHRHNHIDRKYNLLKIDFLQVAVTRQNQDFYLQLTDFDTSFITEVKIPYQELDITATSSNVLAPPQLLLDWLGSCSGEEQQAVIKMREKILSFDERIKEEIEAKNTIRYGKGKTKPVAELCFQRKTNKPVIFLWLPTPTSWRKEVIGRLRLWSNGGVVTHVGHIPEGFGRMKLQPEWDAMPQEKRPKYMFHSGSSKSFTPVPIPQGYNNVSNSLESLVDLALTKWLARI
jgi:RecB family endonuclease NucS